MVLKSLLATFGIRKKENSNLDAAIPLNPSIEKRVVYMPKELHRELNEIKRPAETKPAESQTGNYYIKNFNWLERNKPRLIKNNKLKGRYALISNQRLINSGNQYFALENQAETRGFEKYNIFRV